MRALSMNNRIYLNEDWYFEEAFKDEMISSDYDLKKGQKVRLPHTVKELPLHYFDESLYQMVLLAFLYQNYY